MKGDTNKKQGSISRKTCQNKTEKNGLRNKEKRKRKTAKKEKRKRPRKKRKTKMGSMLDITESRGH
jgi:hypothetical protein